MKKRILGIILVLAMILSFIPVSVAAAEPSLQVQKSGDKVTMTYTVPNSVSVDSLELRISFDKTKLELNTIEWANISGFSNQMGTDAKTGNTNGWFNGTWSNASPVKLSADLVLVTAEFTVKSGAHGSAAFAVTDLTMYNGDNDMTETAGATGTGATCAIPITDPAAISATVTAPVKGQPLATNATVADDAPYTVDTEQYSFLWLEGKGTDGEPATDNAKPNQVYTVRLTLAAKDGESFDVASLNGTTNTDGWTIITLGAPGATTAEKLWLVKTFPATENAAALGGTVTISGTPKYNEQLTAVTSALEYGVEGKGTLGYRWMRDDKSIADATGNTTGNTYTTEEADIGHTISVEVWNSNNTGSVTSAPVTIGKALNNTVPGKPESSAVTTTAESITIVYTDGNYEFACVPKGEAVQEKNWQTGKTFSGLKPNREYDIYVRAAASDTHEASTKSEKLTVKTEKAYADLGFIATLKSALKPYNGVYDGTAHDALDVTGLGTSGWTVQYSTDGNTYSTTMPQVTNVSDSKKVYVTFSNEDYSNQPKCEYNVFVNPKSITPLLPNAAERTYTGSALTTTVSPKDYLNGSQYALVEGTDYTVDYTGYENINVATGGKFKLKGIGNYSGEREWTFKINPKSISDVAIGAIAAQDYTGSQLCPDVTVTGDGKTLTRGTDYTVSYGDNKNAGEEGGSVTVKAAAGGNYSFVNVTETFKINKIVYNGTKEASDMVRSGEYTSGKELSLPNLPDGARYGTPRFANNGLIASASVNFTNVRYVLTYSANEGKDGDKGTITIPVLDATNYFDYDYVVTVTAKDKEDAQVTISDSLGGTNNVTYGREFTATATAANPGEAKGTWTWTSSDPSILEIVSRGDTDTVTVKAKKASTSGATLTATYTSDTHFGTVSKSYTVSQQPIAVSGIAMYDKEYDGTTAVLTKDVDTNKITLGGAFEGDKVFVGVVSGSYDDKDVGSRTATLTLILTGADSGNYYLLDDAKYTVANAQITQKPVTIGGAAVNSRAYDGTVNARYNISPAEYTVNGKVDGDIVNADSSDINASFADKNVGTGKTVTFSGFELEGADAGNYKLTAQPTTTADITPRTFAISSIKVADKTYDGDTYAKVEEVVYHNIVPGDEVYANIIARFDSINADENKSVAITAESWSGRDASNYTFDTTSIPTVTATIYKAQFVGEPTFDKVTKTGTTLGEFTKTGVNAAVVRGVNDENVSYRFVWTDADDTVIEANKSYAWTLKSLNDNYEDLTGSIVLFPVSHSYSDQVKKQSEEYEAKKRGELPEDETGFRDVYEDDYFFDAVQWAAENGITGGVGNDRFGPNLDCSRGQTMTFLWRASGEPEPDSFSTDFTDVASGDYFYEAVLWAMEEGVTTGAGAGRFAPDATVTRGQFVTFLYRLANASSDGVHPFTDVPAGAYYEKAVAWAYAEGITTGTSGTTFSPDAPCTRAQIITFLYRYFNR